MAWVQGGGAKYFLCGAEPINHVVWQNSVNHRKDFS